jgi:hypothetical protein
MLIGLSDLINPRFWRRLMRCPKCYAETPPEALCCPGCKLVTPRGKTWKKSGAKTREQQGQESRRIPTLLVVLAALGATIVFGLGSYLVMVYWADSHPPRPGSSQFILDKVRKLPSTKSGLSIEQCLTLRLDESQKAGRLKESEGWDVRPIDDTRFKVSFTFEEQGSRQQRAEWIVDVSSNTVDPQTDLAKNIYKTSQ